jgi:hypothetical protein
MARWESARSVRQGLRLLRLARREMGRQQRLERLSQANLQLKAADWRPPLLVLPAAVMHLAKPRRQVKSRAMRRAKTAD